MLIYKTLVITLPSVGTAHCKHCCYETHHKAAGNSNANRILSS